MFVSRKRQPFAIAVTQSEQINKNGLLFQILEKVNQHLLIEKATFEY